MAFWGVSGELGEDFALCQQNLHPDLLKPLKKPKRHMGATMTSNSNGTNHPDRNIGYGKWSPTKKMLGLEKLKTAALLLLGHKYQEIRV